MPFGLSDASSTFQRLVNYIFAGLIEAKVLVVYLDHILIHRKDWECHLELLHEVSHDIFKSPI